MKIIHLVLGKANPKRMNGVNKVVHQLANTQASLGKEVCVWGIANDLAHTYPARNFPTQLFQQHKNKTLSASLKEAIKRLSPHNIVHIHGAFILEFYQVARLIKAQGIPYIFTPHGSYSKAAMQKNKWVKKVYFHLLEKWVLKNAKAVQLLGIHEANHLETMLHGINQKLIPNGMDFQQIPTDLPTRNNEEIIFGFCGRLAIYHKGLDLLLEGFQQFLADGGKGTLQLIGDGADRPSLEILAKKLNIQDKVIFHGALFGLKKFHTLQHFDVFLHPSRMEGFPMAVLEAAALSTPCITSEATNINHYIRAANAGIPLSNNTPYGIAKAMQLCAKYYQQNQLGNLGENAHNMVKTAFNWETIAQRLINTYAA